MIPKLSFSRVVREIAVTHMEGVRFSRPAIEAIHESAEAFLCHMFEDVNLCIIHVKRITLMAKNIQLWRTIANSFQEPKGGEVGCCWRLVIELWQVGESRLPL